MELDVIHNADCIEGLKQIPNNSVDLVLTDIPYGEVNRRVGFGIMTKARPML